MKMQVVNFRPEVTDAIRSAARVYHLEPELLAGLVMRESSGDPAATRYEKDYPYLWDVLARRPIRSVDPMTFPSLDGDGPGEWHNQKTSFGLAQVMGAVARQYGFAGAFDPDFLSPTTNCLYGARHLASFLKKWGNESDALSAYNAGAPTQKNYEGYVKAVLKMRDEYRKMWATSVIA